MFFACGIWCVAEVSSVSPSVCSHEGLTLQTSAKHHIPQAKNILYQPLLIKLIFNVLAHAEKQFFSKLVFQNLRFSPGGGGGGYSLYLDDRDDHRIF